MIAMSLASDVYVITWEDLDTFDHGSLVKHVSLQNLLKVLALLMLRIVITVCQRQGCV